jgi:CheY-like chemotaxis protein
MRVLIVDDYIDGAELVALLVKLCGHEPFVAHDGFEALDRARQTVPDLVLMDIEIPGMDGYATAKRLRNELGMVDTPIFALTAFQSDPELEHAAGMQGYYRKPINLEQIRKLLSN